jgi:hypothetical protein
MNVHIESWVEIYLVEKKWSIAIINKKKKIDCIFWISPNDK